MAIYLNTRLKNVSKPPLSRHFIVDDDMTFEEFSYHLRKSYGFDGGDYHLYDFKIYNYRINCSMAEDDFSWYEDDGEELGWTMGSKMSDILCPGLKFTFTYDYGDNWQILITVKDMTDEKFEQDFYCTKATGGSAIEDIGGAYCLLDLRAMAEDYLALTTEEEKDRFCEEQDFYDREDLEDMINEVLHGHERVVVFDPRKVLKEAQKKAKKAEAKKRTTKKTKKDDE